MSLELFLRFFPVHRTGFTLQINDTTRSIGIDTVRFRMVVDGERTKEDGDHDRDDERGNGSGNIGFHYLPGALQLTIECPRQYDTPDEPQ